MQLVILSENTMLIINGLLVVFAFGSTWVAIASYKHTRNTEIAKQRDVDALELKVKEKADKMYVDDQDNSLREMIHTKADGSLVESMDRKLDLILSKLN